MSDHEQLIRERAYCIWEEEGRPNHRADMHWFLASRQLKHDDAQAAQPAAIHGKPKRTKKAESIPQPRKSRAMSGGRATGTLN